jgi:hypothetical protein
MFHLDVSKVDRVSHYARGWRRAACHRASAHTSRLPHVMWLALSSPLPSFSSVSPWQFELDLSGMGTGRESYVHQT